MYHAQLPEPKQALFEAWCDAAHIVRPSVRFGSASASEAGLGLFASRAIAAGEACIIVPVSACISERVARESDVGVEVARENEARRQQRAAAVAAGQKQHRGPHRISPRALLYLYLIHARHAPSNRFSTWLVHGVPRSYGLPLSWSDPERAQLQGTNLGEAVSHRAGQLRSKFNNAIAALHARNPRLFPLDVFTAENWEWAHATYSSRGFPAQLLDPSARSGRSMLPGAVHAENEENGLTMKLGTAAASSSAAASASASSAAGSEESLGCLIPYLDLTNHRFRQRVTWTHHAATSSAPSSSSSNSAAAAVSSSGLSCAHVSFASGDALRVGDEIWNNYGAKPNEELLMGYGFTLRDNEADCLTLALAAAAIPETKRGVIRAAQIQLHHVLSIKSPVPLGLLQLMRACAWDARAVQECSALWLPAVAPELVPASVHADSESNATQLQAMLSKPCVRTELTMLSTLRSLLLGRLRRLQLFDPESSARAATIATERTLDPSSFRVHTVDASAFSVFREQDERARQTNADAGAGSNYHIECALNYRLGQREVLLAALKHVDTLSAEAAGQVATEIQKEQETAAAASAAVSAPAAAAAAAVASASSSSDRKTAPSDANAGKSKRRKTGAASSTVVDAAAESPAEAWTTLLPAYNAWMNKIGAYTNADWSSGQWKLQRECSVAPLSATATSASSSSVAAASSSSSALASSVLLAFPPAFVLSASVIASSSSFAACSQLVSGLEEEQVAVLFLLHERSRGRKSQWSPWIDLLVAMPPPDSMPTPEQEADFDSLRSTLPPAEQSLLDLYTQLFPALSDGYPKLFKPAHHTFAMFLWAASAVQRRWVQFGTNASRPGEAQAAVIPVPVMPASSAIAATVAEELPFASEEDAEAEPASAFVLRSLVPLAAGSAPTFSSGGGIELVSRAHSQCGSSPITMPFGSVLEFRSELRAAQLHALSSRGRGGGASRAALAALLPLRALSDSHQQLFARLSLDEAEEMILPAATSGGSDSSALLCAVARSFFCSAQQLRARSAATVAPSAASGQSASILSAGSRVDDSDEESEEDHDQQQQGKQNAAAAQLAPTAAAAAAATEEDMEEEEEAEADEAEAQEQAEEEAEAEEAADEVDPPQWIETDADALDEVALESSVQTFLRLLREAQITGRSRTQA